jgi:hypothetical protein
MGCARNVFGNTGTQAWKDSHTPYKVGIEGLTSCLEWDMLSPNLGITKEIMSRGPQVLDMEYREPY